MAKKHITIRFNHQSKSCILATPLFHLSKLGAPVGRPEDYLSVKGVSVSKKGLPDLEFSLAALLFSHLAHEDAVKSLSNASVQVLKHWSKIAADSDAKLIHFSSDLKTSVGEEDVQNLYIPTEEHSMLYDEFLRPPTLKESESIISTRTCECVTSKCSGKCKQSKTLPKSALEEKLGPPPATTPKTKELQTASRKPSVSEEETCSAHGSNPGSGCCSGKSSPVNLPRFEEPLPGAVYPDLTLISNILSSPVVATNPMKRKSKGGPSVSEKEVITGPQKTIVSRGFQTPPATDEQTEQRVTFSPVVEEHAGPSQQPTTSNVEQYLPVVIDKEKQRGKRRKSNYLIVC